MARLEYARPQSFYDRFERKGDDPSVTHYCPGCGHGNLHKYIAETVDELGIRDRTVLVSPVGCSVFAYYYFDVGNVQAPHGRAPAVATGLKRSLPGSIVMSYQGDGDLAAIGGDEILHAANRGEHITVFFVNNAIYGMTGGQMAPTTLVGQKTSTSPYGRSVGNEGGPIHVAELLATLEGPAYIERTALGDPKHNAKTLKAVKKALRYQVEGRGFSLVEVLSPCPTTWRMDPVDATKWVLDEMTQVFPLGVFRDRKEEPVVVPAPELAPAEAVAELLGLEDEQSAFVSLPRTPAVYRNPRMKIAGFGGQGILLLGLVLTESGLRSGMHVSWIPSYGPEMRGGTAHCHVNISDARIGSPLVSRPTVLMAMNGPSLERFQDEVEPGGLILFNASLISQVPARDDVEALAVPATRIADELGSTLLANMVMLGAYLEYTELLSLDAAREGLKHTVKRKHLLEADLKALDAGAEWLRELGCGSLHMSGPDGFPC
ncbi:MAG: 2-oxoacid:acceptor oxidoreductase family protein [Candidatus Latescibacterota bacterium]|nr:MAG: 2-oxoacid:acceptor oxidoreductase family protein [Candidatus Latescibacterota bacterium]